MDIQEDMNRLKAEIAKVAGEPQQLETSAKTAMASAKGWLIGTAITFLLFGFAIGHYAK